MRAVGIFLLFLTYVWAGLRDIESFEAAFTQTIAGGENKSIVYTGKLYVKKPQNILWIYEKPVKKEIFITGTRVVTIEHDIEQVTIGRIEDDMNLIAILEGARPLGPGRYEARYKDQNFWIDSNDSTIAKIAYKDKFNNNVTILFSNQKTNHVIDDNLFVYFLDPAYDIVQQ